MSYPVPKQKKMKYQIYIVIMVVLAALIGCANPGSGPDGGPYDETPPRVIGMTPELGHQGTTAQRVTIMFDEFVKVENAAEKIIVSPPQIEMPEIKVSGKRISVELLDTLKKNTTYTIDFSDAITDVNEGNPLGLFTYYFSTGGQVDTMEVAGNVLAAENLEPIKGILVGLHSDLADSAFTTKPFERVARTDSRGFFSIKGVAPGTYRVFALKDMDGDFKYTPGEMMAALQDCIIPSSYPDVRQDTVWRDSVRYDTIRSIPFTHFTPDNLLLLAFTEKNKERHLLKTQRDVPEWFRVYFTAPSTHIPQIKGLNFDSDNAFLEQRSLGNDTITYWLRDTSIPVVDTLRLEYTYEAFNDSLRQNQMRTDTLELIPRNTMARRLKKEAEELEKWEKKREKRHKRGDFSDETPPQKYLTAAPRSGNRLSPIQNPTFVFADPLTRIDTAAIHLLLKKDTLWVDAPFEIKTPEGPVMSMNIVGEWRYGQQYEIQIDSAAFTNLSGLVNRPLKTTFSISREEDFGSLFLHLPGADTTAVVQLLASDTKVECQTPTKNGRADFFYVKPGGYYLRAFYDRNGNGRWDAGNYTTGLQPEEVFYYPEKIEVRPNWDIEQTWRVDDLPLNKQKPTELIKQKEEQKRTPRNLNEERERNKRKR